MPKRATRTAAGKRAEAKQTPVRSGRLAAGAVTDGAQVICPRCGLYSENIVKDFYNSTSPLYEYSHSMPICRTCASELLDKFTVEFGDELMGMNRFCQVVDMYYNEEAAEKTKNRGTNWLSSYVATISKSPYIGKSYMDTIKEGAAIASLEKDHSSLAGVTKKMVRRWGLGYTAAQYTWMQDE